MSSHSLRNTLLASCSGLALVLTAATATASGISLDAKAIYSLDGGTSGVAEQSTPATAFPNILPSGSSAGSSYFGHVYSSNPTGTYQFGSRASGQGYYSIVGTANYTNDFAVGTPGAYRYYFTIDSGDLNVSLRAGLNGTQFSSLSLVVKESIDGGTPVVLFDYESSLSTSSAGATPTFTESGAVLNSAGPTLTPGSGDYAFGQYATSVGLGTLAVGQSSRSAKP